MTSHPLRPGTALTAASLLALAACSSSSSSPAAAVDAGSDVHTAAGDGGMVIVSTSGFNQSCQKSTDCVLVETGSWSATDPCCGHGCPGGAINAADQSKYGAALTQAEAQCMPPGNAGCGVECVAVEAFCNAGTCDVCTGNGCADAGAADAGTE
jgi:hypothetical protein